MRNHLKSRLFIRSCYGGWKGTRCSARHLNELWYVCYPPSTGALIELLLQPLSLVVKAPSKESGHLVPDIESQHNPPSRWTRFTSTFRHSPYTERQRSVQANDVQLEEMSPKRPQGPAAVSTVIVMPSATHPRLLETAAPVQSADVLPLHLPEVGLGHAHIPYKHTG